MLSKKARSLKPSPTLALAAKAKELKAEGHDVISLSVGEPDWDTFDSVKEAGISAIKEGATKYTPSSGTPELRKAIRDQVEQDLGVSYDVNEVTVSTGGKFVIFSALQMLLDPGDEVIIPTPYWVSYPTMVELAEGKPVIAECGPETNFRLTPELLEKHLSDKTKVLILNSPSNPSGEMYSMDELKALAATLKKHPNVMVLSDDIYNRLVFEESGLAPHLLQAEPELQSRTVVINGVSKTYSMTGWRVGWALGPKELIGAMNKYQSQSVSCACAFSQAAAVAAIRSGEPELKEALKKLKERRDFVFEQLSQIDGIEVQPPKGAFYIWPNISQFLGKTWNDRKLESSRDFAQALLEDQMVVTVPGIEFGVEGHIRVSYALEQDRMQQAVDRLKDFLGQLS